MYINVLVFIFINVCSLEKIPDDEVSKACHNSVVNEPRYEISNNLTFCQV